MVALVLSDSVYIFYIYITYMYIYYICIYIKNQMFDHVDLETFIKIHLKRNLEAKVNIELENPGFSKRFLLPAFLSVLDDLTWEPEVSL